MTHKRISKQEIRKISGDYLAQLPTFHRASADTLARVAGPFAQIITFERLSYGDYRPWHFVNVLPSPEKQLGADFSSRNLDYPLRHCHPRLHATQFSKLYDAINVQFCPSPQRPFDEREMLNLCRQETRAAIEGQHTAVPAYSMAIVEAWYGNIAEFATLSDTYSTAIAKQWPRHSWTEVDWAREQFVNETLPDWLASGRARTKLAEIAMQRCEREGIRWVETA